MSTMHRVSVLQWTCPAGRRMAVPRLAVASGHCQTDSQCTVNTRLPGAAMPADNHCTWLVGENRLIDMFMLLSVASGVTVRLASHCEHQAAMLGTPSMRTVQVHWHLVLQVLAV